MSKIPTPHIGATSEEQIAKTVIMPGDPLRAKLIADKYLENVTQFNSVRGMLGFTGTYQGKRLSIMGSGMGIPSMGIYSYELFKFYDVDNIIRVGSAGSYNLDYKIHDVVLAIDSYSESTYAEGLNGSTANIISGSANLNEIITNTAKANNIELKPSIIHTSELFYRKNPEDYKEIHKNYGCNVVEMEAFALFANALELSKNAACLLTVSDSIITHEATSAEERQNSFLKMIELALNSAIKL